MNRGEERTRLLMLLSAVTLLGFLLSRAEQLEPLENLFLRSLRPVATRLSYLGHQAANLARAWREFRVLEAKSRELEERVNALSVEVVRLSEVEAENRLLRQELGFKRAHPSYQLKGALVIGRDPHNLSHQLILDLGAQDGVRKGMPVVTARGLVGRIVQVGSDWSRVLLITDPRSSVKALVQSSRATGIVQGQLSPELVMQFIPQGEVVRVGDLVVTSGLDSSFPKGIVIGQVRSVRQRDFETAQQAIVHPTVDFHRLEMVLIIADFLPTEYGGFEP